MAVRATWRKLAVSGFVLALVGLQALAVAGRFDDWPFAANAMFSYRRSASEPVYDLEVRRYDSSGAVHVVDPVHDLKAPSKLEFRRMFFSRWYGSSDPDFPQRGLTPLEPGEFDTRMLVFCRAVRDSLRSEHSDVEAIAVDLAQVVEEHGAWETGPWRAVVVYDASRDRAHPLGGDVKLARGIAGWWNRTWFRPTTRYQYGLFRILFVGGLFADALRRLVAGRRPQRAGAHPRGIHVPQPARAGPAPAAGCSRSRCAAVRDPGPGGAERDRPGHARSAHRAGTGQPLHERRAQLVRLHRPCDDGAVTRSSWCWLSRPAPQTSRSMPGYGPAATTGMPAGGAAGPASASAAPAPIGRPSLCSSCSRSPTSARDGPSSTRPASRGPTARRSRPMRSTPRRAHTS